jgi:hypothetical protein
MLFSRSMPHTWRVLAHDLTNRSRRSTIVAGAHPTRGPRGGRRRPLPALDDTRLKDLSLDQLRQAIRINGVSFPSPVPTFERHDRPDLQWRIVQLYFVLGWSCACIAERYGLLRQRVCQILNTWKRRAVEMGYVQCIPDI